MKTITLNPGKLTLALLAQDKLLAPQYCINENCYSSMQASRVLLESFIKQGKIIYGVNTGFGKHAHVKIEEDKLQDIQRNIILSHAVGTGKLLSPQLTRRIMLLKINTLAQGFSGVRKEVVDMLCQLLNQNVLPCIPEKGSVGASGDLAPLAHMSYALLGEGEVFFQSKVCPAKAVFEKLNIKPLQVQAKEGLSLVNGTEVSLALLIEGFLRAASLFESACLAAALSFVVLQGRMLIFDEKIHQTKRIVEQVEIAKLMNFLIGEKWAQNSGVRTQDPYTLRCIPQVLGACLVQLRHVLRQIKFEINAVTDNPLIFCKTKQILSGGNFHGQHLSQLADILAIVITTLANFSERRIALLLNSNASHLPDCLIKNSGENSGLMMMQVTAAALASENKVFSHPASVDSIPTSGNQEDFVSMSTFSSRRLEEILNNTRTIVAIELMLGAQGFELHPSLALSDNLSAVFHLIRQNVSKIEQDTFLAQKLEKMNRMIDDGTFSLQHCARVSPCSLFDLE